MTDVSNADRLRLRRAASGLTQRELAAASGVKQPLIAAIESGSRQPTNATRRALDDALQVRPSQLLQEARNEVLAAVRVVGGEDIRIFGSVAPGRDRPDSDLDLLVTFPPGADIVTLLNLEEELANLLTVPVDVVSAGSSGSLLERSQRMCAAVIEGHIQRRLDDLIRFGNEAAYLVNKGQPAYLATTMEGALLRNAGERILIKIAIVVEKLPEEFKTQHSEIDWDGITRMRNLVAHHYDKVNDDLLWRALTARIPNLVASVGT